MVFWADNDRTTTNQIHEHGGLAQEANHLFRLFFLFFGLFTVLFHLLFILGSDFRILGYAADVLSFGFVIYIFRLIPKLRKAGSRENREERRNRWVLICTVLILALVSSLAIRPDGDDTFYISLPIYYLHHIHENFSLVNHSYAFLNHPPILELDSIFFIQTVDYVWSWLASLFRCEYIDIYYLFVPWVFGGLIPLAWFALMKKFSDDTTSCMVGTIAICAFLLLNGQEHRAFGNFSFVRIWQGKVILMGIGIPASIALAMDFFEKPDWKNWLVLAAAGAAAVGFTKTSLFLYPLLLFFIGIAHMVAEIRYGRPFFKTLFAYWATGFYPFLLAVIFKFIILDAGIYRMINEHWANDFTGQFHYVFGEFWSVGSICCFLFLFLGVLLVRKDRRFLLIGWNGMVFLMVNPILFYLVAEHITTTNTYWRLFYLLPYPLSIGIAAAALSQRLRITHAFKWLLLAILSVTVISLIPGTKTTLNRVHYGFFEHKVKPWTKPDIAHIIQAAPAGPMILPRKYSAWLQIYTSDYPLVMVLFNYIKMASMAIDDPALYETRMSAVRLVEGRYSDENLANLKRLMDQGLVNMVIRKGVAGHPKVKALMDEYGFRVKGRLKDYVILSRL